MEAGFGPPPEGFQGLELPEITRLPRTRVRCWPVFVPPWTPDNRPPLNGLLILFLTSVPFGNGRDGSWGRRGVAQTWL